MDAVEPRIRELLGVWPGMPATVIAERIGWDHSIRVLRDRVAELRPAYLPPDPASRTVYEPGELAQFDFWFPDIRLPVGPSQWRTAKQLPVLTMVSGYSRCRGAVLVPTRGEQDLSPGWWQLLQGLGAVPRTLVRDGEGAVGRWRARQPELTGACQGFRGVLGAKVIICSRPTRRPRGWSSGSTTTSSVRCCPDGNDYSVHPSVIGRRVSVTANLFRVGVMCEGRTVAEHARSWARHHTFTDPEHAAAAVALRRAHIEAARPPRHTEVEVRDLTSYDTLLGVDADTDTATGGVA